MLQKLLNTFKYMYIQIHEQCLSGRIYPILGKNLPLCREEFTPLPAKERVLLEQRCDVFPYLFFVMVLPHVLTMDFQWVLLLLPCQIQAAMLAPL